MNSFHMKENNAKSLASTPTSTRKSATASPNHIQLPSPPSSHENGEGSAAAQKRKRQATATPNAKLQPRKESSALIATPNPKPRKQSKVVYSSATDSPTKPRSRTPTTHYESTREMLTPSRESNLSPPLRSKPRTGRAKIVIKVKQEKPDIDLSLPIPPPSPTDDPILLHGHPRIIYDVDNGTSIAEATMEDVIQQPVFSLPNASTPRKDEPNSLDSSPSNSSASKSRTSSSPPQPDVPSYFNFSTIPARSPDNAPSDSDTTTDDDPMPAFSLEQPEQDIQDSWSSDESGGEEGEGEYTGTFHAFTIPIKPDPPNSSTKARMDVWESKVRRSPHPKAVVQHSSPTGNSTLASLAEESDHSRSFRNTQWGDDSVLEYAEDDPPPAEEGMSTAHTGLPGASADEDHMQLPSPPSSPLPPPFEPASLILPSNEGLTSTPHAGNATRPEFDFSTFITPGAIGSTSVAPHDWAADQALAASGDEEEDDESDLEILDPTIIKITSSDPFAAARATAILKQHDYECYTRTSLRRSMPRSLDDLTRNAKRRDFSLSSIQKAKSRSPLKSPRKAVGVYGDSVFIEGSPMRTLPDLLNDAEEEVTVEQSILGRNENPFRTPAPRLTARTPGGEWEKDDWKALDACFTDERLALGSDEGVDVLAEVEEVDLAQVARRFIELYEYDEDEYEDGPWSKKGLIKRAQALRNKQRNGKGAPPTSGYSRRASSSFSFRNDSPSFEVPDFTPSVRRYNRPVLPEPNNERNPFSQTTQVPKTLLAPRYSHLLDEARAVSFSSPSLPLDLEPKDEPSEANLSSEKADGIGGRVKSIIYSYLRAESPSSSNRQSPNTSMTLPLPPPVAGPRPPIVTPARIPSDKPVLPHVDLNHASPPSGTSKRKGMKTPRRLVKLNHVPTPQSTKPMRRVTRKGSTGSVKDLVRSFEDLDQSTSFERSMSLDRSISFE